MFSAFFVSGKGFYETAVYCCRFGGEETGSSDKFQGAHILIIDNTIVGDALKDGFVLREDNPLGKEWKFIRFAYDGLKI